MTDKFFDFIEKNQNQDTNALRLALHNKNLDFNLDFALLQIDCRKKTKRKLPLLLQNSRFLFPDALSAEQASAEALAIYHSSLICQGNDVLDMTTGLGIDSINFSNCGKTVVSIEVDLNKSRIFAHNIKVLGKRNITPVCGDSVTFLRNTNSHFDVIFVDPARRDISLNRVFGLRDCMPDVLGLEKLLLEKADRILIKASPMLDITQTLKDFSSVSFVSAVGIKGECKEILIELKSNQPSSSKVLNAINLDNEGNIISEFQSIVNPYYDSDNSFLQLASFNDLQPGSFILEPSPMLMKIAPWSEVCRIYKAKKFDSSSNLFISNESPQNFPGRVTCLKKVLTKKDRKSLIGLPVSVVSRNFPQSSEILRKRLKVKEGEENFLYASRIKSQPVMLLCKKVQNL